MSWRGAQQSLPPRKRGKQSQPAGRRVPTSAARPRSTWHRRRLYLGWVRTKLEFFFRRENFFCAWRAHGISTDIAAAHRGRAGRKRQDRKTTIRCIDIQFARNARPEPGPDGRANALTKRPPSRRYGKCTLGSASWKHGSSSSRYCGCFSAWAPARLTWSWTRNRATGIPHKANPFTIKPKPRILSPRIDGTVPATSDRRLAPHETRMI